MERVTPNSTVNSGSSARRRGGSIALKMLADRSLQFFSTQAEALFDQVGDVLFDLAESSEEDQVQGIYLDAIRIIREERAAISGRWLNAISSAFDTIGADPASGGLEKKSGLASRSGPTSDMPEESLELDRMIATAANRSSDALATLHQRVSCLLDTRVSPRSLPLSAERLSNQFVRAIEGSRLDSQARLVLLGQYEKLVLASLPEFLEQSDQLLASLGIAAVDNPRHLYQPGANASADDSSVSNDDGSQCAGGAAEAGDNTPSADTNAEPAQGHVPRPSNIRREPPKPDATERRVDQLDKPGGSLLISRPALCELLEQVAQEQAGCALDGGSSGDRAFDAEAEPGWVELKISQRLSREGDSTLELGENDRSVIHLVDGLFEYLLEDIALPNTLVRLLMRTALPFARAALSDSSLLEAHHHPARRLLAEIVQCAEELRDVENIEADNLYGGLVEAVACFEHAPMNARELSGALLKLVREVERERELARGLDAALMEQAIEKEKVDSARCRVEELLESRLLGKQFGYALVIFVEQVWAGVLFATLSGEGLESERWHGAVHLLDQLLGLESATDVEPKLIDEILGAMVKTLVDGGRDAGDISPWLDRIRDYLLRGKLRPENIHPLILEKVDAREANDYSLRVLVDTVETRLPGEFDAEIRELAAKVGDSVLAEIDSLKQGCWVRTQDQDSHSHRYWRLVGSVGASEKFLFSDRCGQHTFMASRASLAVKLKHGELLILGNPQRFEKSLSRAVREHSLATRRLIRPGRLANSGGLRA